MCEDFPAHFHMLSDGKRSHSAGLIPRGCKPSASRLQLFPFASRFPFNNLNLLNCTLCLDCGTWALHVRMLLQIYDTLTVFAGRRQSVSIWVDREQKKIPLQSKITTHNNNNENKNNKKALSSPTLHHKHLPLNDSKCLPIHPLIPPPHTCSVCPFTHTPLVPNHKFKQKTKKQQMILSKCAAYKSFFFFFTFTNGGC